MEGVKEAMLIGILTIVSFIMVKVFASSNIYGSGASAAYNASNATSGEMILHDFLPLIVVFAGILGVVLAVFAGLHRAGK